MFELLCSSSADLSWDLARDRTSRREWIRQDPVGKNGSREMFIGGVGGGEVLIQACRQKGDGGGS